MILGASSPLRAHGSQGARWPYRIANSSLARGIVFFLPCDPGAGFAYDLRNNRRGTVNGTPTWVGGPNGRAVLDLSDAGDFLSFANGGPWTLESDFTVHVRWRLTAASSSFDPLLGDYDSGTGGSGWGILVNNSSGQIDARIGSSGGFNALAMGATPATGTWLDLTVRYDRGSTQDIEYLRDLGAITTVAGTKTLTRATNAFYINRNSQNTRDAPVQIERAILWDRKLSDGEMYSLHRPETRWSLYSEDSLSPLIDAAAAGGVTPATGYLNLPLMGVG